MIKHLEKEDNFNELIKEGKTLVDFYAEWCGPCKMQGAVLEELEDINIIKVNTDENPELAQEYGVMSIPTLILFENGNIKEQSVGFKSKSEVEDMVK